MSKEGASNPSKISSGKVEKMVEETDEDKSQRSTISKKKQTLAKSTFLGLRNEEFGAPAKKA